MGFVNVHVRFKLKQNFDKSDLIEVRSLIKKAKWLDGAPERLALFKWFQLQLVGHIWISKGSNS